MKHTVKNVNSEALADHYGSVKSTSRRRAQVRYGAVRDAIQTLESRVLFAAFTPGDLVVVRAGDGIATLSNASSQVSLVELTTAGANPGGGANVINLPSATSGANNVGNFSVGGNTTTEGGLNLSRDGRYVS